LTAESETGKCSAFNSFTNIIFELYFCSEALELRLIYSGFISFSRVMALSFILLMRYEYIIFNFLCIYLPSIFDIEFYFRSFSTVSELSKRGDSSCS